MQLTIVETNGKATSTGPFMHAMVRQYHNDMLPLAHLSLWEIFERIKGLPFRSDPDGVEVLMRPAYTMTMTGDGGDCDDKCIALASWAYLHGGRQFDPSRPPRPYDYRFVAVRRFDKNTLHHVICELYIGNSWIHADPTYQFNTLGRERERYAEYVVI